MKITKLSPKTQNILIVFAIAIIITLGILSYGIYSMYSFFSQIGNSREMPAEIKEPRILKGNDFLTKSEFFKVEASGFFDAVKEGVKTKGEKERQEVIQSKVSKGIYGFDDIKVFNDEIFIVARYGGFVLYKSGKLKREISFELNERKIKIGWYEHKNYDLNLDNLQIVQLEEGKIGFLAHSSSEGVSIFDSNGKTIWNYGKRDVDLDIFWQSEEEREKDYEKSTHILEATVGDLDNDGISEFIVGQKNIGLLAFNQKGEQLWLQKDEFPSNKLIINDLDSDGKNELIETGKQIRNGKGEVIKEIKGGGSQDAVLFYKNDDRTKTLQYCAFFKSKLKCEDSEENTIIESDAPLSSIKLKNPQKVEVPFIDYSYIDDSEDIAFPKAFWVKMKEKEPKYLVILGAYIGLPRANFYVYKPNGELVYHELLSEEAETIAVLPTDNEVEQILIGGKDTIWKFAAK